MSNFWPDFQNVEDLDSHDLPACVIISDVLSTFDIPSGGVSGGTLQNVSLKRVSPINAIKASLLELMVDNSNPVEFRVNEDGRVVTYIVGSGGGLSSSDIYYTISSSGYIPSKAGVMVTGGKPKVKRIIFPWETIIGAGAEDYTIFDSTQMDSNCLTPNFTTSAIITYNDPILTKGSTSYANGIDELFEVRNPFQSIVGYAWEILPSWSADKEPLVKIFQQGQSTVPMLLSSTGQGLLPTDDRPGYTLGINSISPYIGDPRRRGPITGEPSDCYVVESGPVVGGKPLTITIPLNEGLTYNKYGSTVVNKFVGLSGIYFVGINLYMCRGVAALPSKLTENTADNTVVVIASDNDTESVYKLSGSEEYTVNYGEFGNSSWDSNTIEVQFANNSRQNDHGTYGSNVKFYIKRSSTDLYNLFSGNQPVEGALQGYGTILPTKNSGGGLLVKQVWVKVDLETPSFVISDPNGEAAQKAKKLKVSLTAIALEEKPPPVAVNGQLINQEDGFKDSDPTTKQNFEDTELAQAYRLIDSGRTMSLSLGSLDEAGVTSLSKNLYDLIREDTGLTYTHTCSPTSNPKLGGSGPNGGIVNSITYSYQDQGSYLINVVEGPKYYGDFAGLSSGIYQKKTEDITAVGTIIQDLGNHIDFKVRVDGIGDVIATNGYPGVLGYKDRVQITLYNNPVEE